MNGKLILIDARLWPLEIRPKAEERLAPPLAHEIAWETAEEPQEPLTNKLSTREIAILQRIVRETPTSMSRDFSTSRSRP